MLRSNRGFSLIELLMVVSIMGVLATLSGPDLIRLIKISATKSHMKSIARNLEAARATGMNGSTPLMNVSGSACAFCDGGLGAGTNMREYVPNPAYIAAWRRLGFDQPPRDPFGGYYALDENDGEFPGDCRRDAIWSAGPDNIWDSFGGGDDRSGDDLIVRLTPLTLPNTCPENGS